MFGFSCAASTVASEAASSTRQSSEVYRLDRRTISSHTTGWNSNIFMSNAFSGESTPTKIVCSSTQRGPMALSSIPGGGLLTLPRQQNSVSPTLLTLAAFTLHACGSWKWRGTSRSIPDLLDWSEWSNHVFKRRFLFKADLGVLSMWVEG